MSRESIYRSSAHLDIEADDLESRAKEARAKALRLRWMDAPEWANCIVKPSKHNRLQSKDDWRWANRDCFGWFHFAGGGRSAAEAGNWTIVERRP